MQQTEVKQDTKETPFNKYSLQDILINPNERKYKFDENFIKCSNTNWKKQFAKYDIPDASEIIPSWFYLGNKMDISDKALLTQLGITHILNVSDTLPCYFPNDFTYAQIEVDDSPSYNIQQYFDAATQFMDQINPQYNENNQDHHLKLFVHCAVGKSRSSTIVIQYLMRRGIDFSNDEWLKKIEQFGLISSFINDDRIYKLSKNFNNVLCCQCCICWLTCCVCCNCCSGTNNMSEVLSNDSTETKMDEKYSEWRNVCDIGTMSYRNSCDYVQKCREIICPNESFATQLAEFEESVRNDISTFEKCFAWKHNGFKPKRCYEHLKDKGN